MHSSTHPRAGVPSAELPSWRVTDEAEDAEGECMAAQGQENRSARGTRWNLYPQEIFRGVISA